MWYPTLGRECSLSGCAGDNEPRSANLGSAEGALLGVGGGRPPALPARGVAWAACTLLRVEETVPRVSCPPSALVTDRDRL